LVFSRPSQSSITLLLRLTSRSKQSRRKLSKSYLDFFVQNLKFTAPFLSEYEASLEIPCF